MKSLVAACAVLGLLFGGVAGAADPTPAQQAQQQRMTQCNKDAAGKSGDERKAFMKSCLSTRPAMTQQQKMTACNKDAAGKSGDERKAFMKECLSA
jgi:hypothetical protein